MTTSQQTAEIFQNLSVLAESEDMMKRVAKYLRKLVKEQKADPTLMSKEEFFEKLDKAEEDYQKGIFTTLQPGESVTDMLKRCGYGI
ncbi:MAG: hypothetical protein IKJ10_11365 [Bacteroidaceae bacterium]|nr:hypothetical protein [Bacteroidaceae bacterium]